MSPSRRLRVAQFNIQELTTSKLTDVDRHGCGLSRQLQATAQIIQEIRPDILSINEIDHDYHHEQRGLELNLRRYLLAYLNQGDNPINFEHLFAAPCNTGILSGYDLNKDGYTSTLDDEGTHDYALDCWGYGHYPGHFAMGLMSNVPIHQEAIRTFQNFRWIDLDGHHFPYDGYPEGVDQVMRLSSKSHWDVPLSVDGQAVHLLMSHPTPRGFYEGRERIRPRNFDEVKFWAEYLNNNPNLYDDAGQKGGLPDDAPCILIGDQNADADSQQEIDFDGLMSMQQLTRHPRLLDTGASITSKGGLNGHDAGPPHFYERHTICHPEGSVRFDYILPSTEFKVLSGGVYWPSEKDDPEGARRADLASDHRLIWLDIELPE
jgi:endonuclease/exonuclease/phosphatase family metal-dependent hydrolase